MRYHGLWLCARTTWTSTTFALDVPPTRLEGDDIGDGTLVAMVSQGPVAPMSSSGLDLAHPQVLGLLGCQFKVSSGTRLS